MLNIDEKEISILMTRIQRELDSKNLEALLEYYHPEIIYISPAFPHPIKGITDLASAFESHFKTPQRTASEVVEIIITRLGDSSFAVTALVEGRQIIYYSEQRFRGWLSRIFIERNSNPQIILDHFTLVK